MPEDSTKNQATLRRILFCVVCAASLGISANFFDYWLGLWELAALTSGVGGLILGLLLYPKLRFRDVLWGWTIIPIAYLALWAHFWRSYPRLTGWWVGSELLPLDNISWSFSLPVFGILFTFAGCYIRCQKSLKMKVTLLLVAFLVLYCCIAFYGRVIIPREI